MSCKILAEIIRKIMLHPEAFNGSTQKLKNIQRKIMPHVNLSGTKFTCGIIFL